MRRIAYDQDEGSHYKKGRNRDYRNDQQECIVEFFFASIISG